ncbi:MAG TPA: signal recognition particle-docking protein FtsY [Desulfomonilaceae bacterium]|nr:signal recognition particle-docking protein FtsY [Desulfomonilaceae bacterium]
MSETKKSGFFSRLFKREKIEEENRETTAKTREETASPTPEPLELAEAEILKYDDHEKDLVKLKTGLKKTRQGFLGRLDKVFLGKKQLDDQMVARLEEVLVTADIGVKTAYELLESVTERVKRREVDDPEAVVAHLKNLVREMLLDVEAPLRVGYGSEPFVVMVVGVNGSGKTTTIAKIAARHTAAGRKVLMVAGDTFRAAAVEQLEIWAKRIGCPLVKGKEKADPSSVSFEAMELALKEDVELVLVDTAGRLHTRVPLMEELKKVKRTLAKKLPAAPHETLLVIDASMGQNAILQARTFNEVIPVTGIALTKLDGTSKGGVVVGMSNELKIPVRYVGVGEKVDDLREFNARDFAEALFAGIDVSEED